MNYKTHFLSILFLVSFHLNAQHKNNFEAGLYNIGFGGVVGGVGAIINKKPNEKTVKVFLKGLYQGALGGYLIFESKRLVGKFGKSGNYAFIWPSKIINSAGTSIMENAASNISFWERWHINLGFNRFELNTKNKFKISYRIMPFAFVSTIYGFMKGKIDINKSLKMGTFVFFTNKISSENPEGIAFANSILLLNRKNRTLSKKHILSHELLHTYQYESFSGLNAFLNKPIQNFKAKNKWFKKYHKIFYTDFNYITGGVNYLIYKNYESNFFEKEARFYTE